MFSYLSWNCVNIDIIFYRVNNSVAAILSIISIIQHLRRRSFLFFFLHRTIETIKPLCVYQFPGYHNRVETSIFNISSLYRRVYKAVTTSRVVGELSAPLSVRTHSQHGVGLLKFVNFILCLLHPLFILLSPLLVQLLKFS